MITMTELLAITGLSAAVIAAIAWTGDRRRIRRKNLDKVGFMPWTPIFFAALLVAVSLLGLAARAWFAN